MKIEVLKKGDSKRIVMKTCPWLVEIPPESIGKP